MAKEVANATTDVVNQIKSNDPEESAEKRDTVTRSTNALIRSVNALVQYSSLPEFAPISAKISNKGRQTQEPIVSAGRSVIQGSSFMLQSAKSLAVNPKDPPTWQQLAQHSKHVSDSIKRLVTALRYNSHQIQIHLVNFCQFVKFLSIFLQRKSSWSKGM